MQELESFEVKTMAAGNQALDASRSEGTGHPDLAIAAATALYHSNVGAAKRRLRGFTNRPEENKPMTRGERDQCGRHRLLERLFE